MALRERIADAKAIYQDPVMGVDLRTAEADLVEGQARLMQNCVLRGGIRKRLGSTKLAGSLASAFRIRGGHKYYYGGASPAKKRLVAYNQNISVISDAGAETVLTSGMTADLDTHFQTWSITDKVYMGNGTDTLRSYDGTTFSTVSGTAIPASRWLCTIVDRMLAITTNGIERTNPRDPTIWSNNSSWATIRPSLTGLFTTMYPHSFLVGGGSTLLYGVLAFQPNAHYLITGTNFGADVTAATASTGENSAIQLLDPRVGTSSPYSVTSVPGLGTFFFTSDLNVFYIPYGSTSGVYIGDRLKSTGSTAGIESVNTAALNQVWMAYFDRWLILGIPTGSNTWTDTQWWLDLWSYQYHADRGPVWYGPMTGQSLSRVWVESQQGDYALQGGEGNPTNNAYVYNLYQSGTYTDAVAAANNNIAMEYRTHFKHFNTPSRRKYIRNVEFDLNNFSGSASCDLYGLSGIFASGLPVTSIPR